MRTFVLITSAMLLLTTSACHRGAAKVDSVKSENVEIALFAINDFHGNLEAANFSAPGIADTPVLAGGTAYLSSKLQALRQQHQNHLFVGVGDLIGASPLLSSMLEDRPAHAALAALGMKYSAVGNHEFDYRVSTLLAMQNGGCAEANCAPEARFEAAKFQYLASNVIDAQSQQLLFPGSVVESIDGVQLGIVAATLRDTPGITLAKNVAGASFLDEADGINQQVAKLKTAGVRSIVAMIHQGGDSKTPLSGDASCDTLSGEIVPMLAKLDPEIDVVLTAHTHKLYVCRYQNMLVTQGASYGRVLTEVVLKIDRKTGQVQSSLATNHLVDSSKLSADPAQLAIIANAKSKTDAVTQKIVSYLSVAAISKKPDASGESDLARLIADAQWFATKGFGADIALINDGGVRTDLPNVEREKTTEGYAVTVGDIYGVQPFGNEIYVLQLSGDELIQVLEAQIDGEDRLTGSSTLRYQIDRSQAKGQRIQQLMIAGKPLRLDGNYRVAINNYLASGGSKQTTLIGKKALHNAGFDRDALTAYLQTQPAADSYQQIRSSRK
jgi:5'-nucleotidase